MYAEIRRRVCTKLPDSRPGYETEGRHRPSQGIPPSGSRLLEQVGRGLSEPVRPMQPPAAYADPTFGTGPPAGRFPLVSSEDETGGWMDYRTSRKERNKRIQRNQKYGHKEDDLDFFQGAFQDEISALQQLNLGDDFRYLSDEAFARFFPEFDFVKAMRGSSLRKWDGMVRDYPAFKHNYYRMIFVQREHYMHKILALEQMVPDKMKTELFHGLQYTVEDLGQ